MGCHVACPAIEGRPTTTKAPPPLLPERHRNGVAGGRAQKRSDGFLGVAISALFSLLILLGASCPRVDAGRWLKENMEYKYFEMDFGSTDVSLNGTRMSYEQAMMVAVHIIEYIGSSRTLVDLQLASRGDESKPCPSDRVVDSSPSTPEQSSPHR